jgi:hypothetical protein
VLPISDRALLDEAIRLTETFLYKDVVWAATQNVIPRAMARTSYAGGIADASLFSPIDVDDWYRLLLPEHRDACIHLCANARTVSPEGRLSEGCIATTWKLPANPARRAGRRVALCGGI